MVQQRNRLEGWEAPCTPARARTRVGEEAGSVWGGAEGLDPATLWRRSGPVCCIPGRNVSPGGPTGRAGGGGATCMGAVFRAGPADL